MPRDMNHDMAIERRFGMAFFDKLGQTISHAGHTAVQKTKDITDVARINSMISEEEKNRKRLYYDIGEKYVSLHFGDFEAPFAELMQQLKATEEKIHTYQQQLQDIKGIIHCERCGAAVSSGAAFCSGCGAALSSKAKQSDLIKCSGCGAMLDKDMRFCDSCGKPVSEIQMNNDMQVKTSDPEPATEPSVPKLCPNCGEVIEDEHIFCAECGAKL